jgi:hypothetical protein
MNSAGYLENPPSPLSSPVCTVHPLRGGKRADNPYILLPRWEEVGRRGFSSFLGGPQGHDKLDIPALKELDMKRRGE